MLKIVVSEKIIDISNLSETCLECKDYGELFNPACESCNYYDEAVRKVREMKEKLWADC